MLTAVMPAAAQRMTLRQCIDRATEQNISIRQRDIARQKQELSLSTAENSRLPDLNASLGQNFSFGRGLTAANTYTNTNTSNTSFSLGTSVPLFTGMNIPNTIRMNRLNLDAATADLEKARNDMRMQVTQTYVETLYNMEIVEVARRQVAIDSMQTARLQAMLDAGKAAETDVAQQKATLAQSRLTATQAANNLANSLLMLSQLIELPSADSFSIVRPALDDSRMEAYEGARAISAERVYAEAVGIKPEIQAEQLRLQGTERSISIARSALYPQLSLSAGIGTNYYKTSGFLADAFATQIKNNFSQYVGLSLSVPIFNRFQTRNSIRAAKLDRETQMLQLDNAKKTLYKEIQQVCCNASAAAMKHRSSTAAAKSSEAAFRLMTAKYENGKANITEFNEAKNNWLKAESDLVQARYELIYQSSLIDFYRGRDLLKGWED